MFGGLYTSGIGMLAQEVRQNNISNNIANISTPGYKKSELSLSSFQEVLINKYDAIEGSKNGLTPIGKMNNGVRVEKQTINWSGGDLEETGNDTDFALTSDGFFTIDTPDGLRYTRNGGFKLDFEGYLVNSKGESVLGENGLIQVSSSDFTLTETGDVLSEGEFIDKLLVTDFNDRSKLEKVGDDVYIADNSAGEKTIDYPQVRQGYLERPNFNLVNELVNMMSGLRVYEANQRALQIHDQILEKIIQIGNVR